LGAYLLNSFYVDTLAVTLRSLYKSFTSSS